MLRTNTKKAKENIHAFIMDCVSDEYLNGPKTWTACKKVVQEEFNGFYYGGNYQESFNKFMQGLPLGFDFYYHCNAKEIVADILEETQEEANRYTEEEAAALLSWLIFRETH